MMFEVDGVPNNYEEFDPMCVSEKQDQTEEIKGAWDHIFPTYAKTTSTAEIVKTLEEKQEEKKSTLDQLITMRMSWNHEPLLLAAIKQRIEQLPPDGQEKYHSIKQQLYS